MSPSLLITLLIAWLAVTAVARWVVVPVLARGPGGDPWVGALVLINRVYCRIWHRAIHTGAHILPGREGDPRGLVVVSNHTGALDPLLIQARCRFLIRWMMAEEMILPQLRWLSRLGAVIPVSRNGRDSGPLREAIRHVQRGGAVGIFPEGRITVPPREVRPFLPGAGLIIARTAAPVLAVWVSGTPDTNRMAEAMQQRSHARIAFLEIMQFPGERDPAVICARLRARIAAASGWPLNETALPPGGAEPDEPPLPATIPLP